MRKMAFIVTLLVGLVLAVVGFYLTAPIGPTSGPEISNARIPFAAGILVLGVLTMFLSAAVYEIFPEHKE